MVKIEKSSDELNHFISRVHISPEHAASFTGLVKNQFPSLTRKEIRKRAKNNLFHYLLTFSFTHMGTNF